jgi:hypothetical protein
VTCWNSITYLRDPLLSLNRTVLHVCSSPVWHDETDLFHQHCRCYLQKISERSWAVLWISIVQYLQHQHCPCWVLYLSVALRSLWPSFLANSFDLSVFEHCNTHLFQLQYRTIDRGPPQCIDPFFHASVFYMFPVVLGDIPIPFTVLLAAVWHWHCQFWHSSYIH